VRLHLEHALLEDGVHPDVLLEIEGGQICVEEGWRHGPRRDLGRRWEAGEVGTAVRELIARAAVPDPVYGT